MIYLNAIKLYGTQTKKSMKISFDIENTLPIVNQSSKFNNKKTDAALI